MTFTNDALHCNGFRGIVQIVAGIVLASNVHRKGDCLRRLTSNDNHCDRRRACLKIDLRYLL